MLTSPPDERWEGANGLRNSDNFVLALHYRRPNNKTEPGSNVGIADGWVGAEYDDNHKVMFAALAPAVLLLLTWSRFGETW